MIGWPAGRRQISGPRKISRPRGIYVALGLLTACAVFAATAGVREALVTTTQALRQTLAAAPSITRTITVSADWDSVSAALNTASPSGLQGSGLTDAQVTEITGQLHADYDHGVVTLAPASTDWASLTSGLNLVQSPLPATGGTAVRLELTYRQPLSQHMRLVAGRFPAAPPPPVAPPVPKSGPVFTGPGSSLFYTPLLQVVVTQQTAATFGLRVGSKVQVSGPQALGANGGAITLQVSGIVVPTDPASGFWTADATAAVPDLEGGGSMTPPPYWVGAAIAGPGAAAAVQQDFGPGGLTMQWGFPLALESITGQQAQQLSDALTSLSAQTPPLTGDVAPIASTMSASTDLLTTIGAYLATAQSVDALLWLLYVSLAVTGLAVLLLAARMVAMRRSAELAVIRARGASLWQVALATGGAAAVVCVPSAVIAVALAIVAVPGAGSADVGSAGGWWPPAAVLAVAICGPALIASWQHRLPRHRAAVRGQPRGRARLVAEVTLIAASLAGIVVFRQQGTVPGSGVNLYTSAAPVLVAIPAVIVVLRIYPLVLRGLLRASARSSGAPAFLGLARAARSTLTPALPAFALVLALTVAAFAGMVRDAVSNGDVATSWKAAGADVTISGQSAFPGFAIPPAAVRAIGAVPGVTHEAEAWPAPWLTGNGLQLTVVAVDPASYAALVAAAQAYPATPARLLSVPATPGAAQPVLASPQAAASLGSGATSISTLAAVRPVTVRVAGVVSATPAWPAGGSFVIMPLAALKSTATPPMPIPITEVLLTGPGIDRARLATVLRDDLPPGGIALYRSDVLSGLTRAPLQHGAFLLFTLSIALAAILGLAVMFLELALGTAEREATLARLATMGLGEGQRARVVTLEVLPAVIAAAAAAWACALVLPWAVAPAINLSVFTSTPILVPLAPDVSSFVGAVPLVPDVASVALPLAALIAGAVVALGIEIRSRRRRGVTTALRIGG
jgi:putative ABC transport system permease protein